VAADAGREPAARESVYVVSGDGSREAITSSLRALLRRRHHDHSGSNISRILTRLSSSDRS